MTETNIYSLNPRVSVPKRKKQLNWAPHNSLTVSRRAFYFPGNQTSNPLFSRQPKRGINIRTISSGYDIVMAILCSTAGATSDMHDIFWQKIRLERHSLDGDCLKHGTGPEKSMRDQLLWISDGDDLKWLRFICLQIRWNKGQSINSLSILFQTTKFLVRYKFLPL